MVAFKRHNKLYWFRLELYVQFQRRSSVCSLVECSEVLTIGYTRSVKRGRRVKWDCRSDVLRVLSPWKDAMAALI
jgi:hypothetical protein